MRKELPAARYCMTVRNRPGELVKLTKLLSEAGMNVRDLRVANLGRKAEIQFATEPECVLPARLRASRIG
ncbi:MAG: hypothetical protein ACHQ49_07510 [Elusimicrobiota bacterium]